MLAGADEEVDADAEAPPDVDVGGVVDVAGVVEWRMVDDEYVLAGWDVYGADEDALGEAGGTVVDDVTSGADGRGCRCRRRLPGRLLQLDGTAAS